VHVRLREVRVLGLVPERDLHAVAHVGPDHQRFGGPVTGQQRLFVLVEDVQHAAGIHLPFGHLDRHAHGGDVVLAYVSGLRAEPVTPVGCGGVALPGRAGGFTWRVGWSIATVWHVHRDRRGGVARV